MICIDQSGEAPALAPCALLTPVVWTPSVMLAATEVETPDLSVPAREFDETLITQDEVS